jgi:CHAT domain-containing protein
VFVSAGILGLIPLHAAWWPDPSQVTARHHLLDERTISYIPSARALAATHLAAARQPAEDILVIADPQPTSHEPIGYAQPEAAWARRWFTRHQTLSGPYADHDTVIRALPSTHVHHFICHGATRPGAPLDSALLLADDSELTLREILAMRLTGPGSGVRLAVLSACDTDRPDPGLPDEGVSLPNGLIQAGAAGVLATRWSVRSEAMSLLAARFYQLWRDNGLPPPEALRAAQRWLRDTTNREKLADLTAARDPHDTDAAELLWALRLRDPEARPYSHPVDWAVASYHGS